MKISIIIPVYNAEKFLERCVDSVLKSLGKADLFKPGDTSTRGEILLINNGSTDKSREICEKYSEKYPLAVSVLECQVAGASAARNLGAKEARGEFIWFVDADDEISATAVSELLGIAEKERADLVMMGAERIYPDQHRNYLSAVRPDEKDYKSRFIRYGAGPWQFLIRRSWWNKYHFRFREGIIHEDMELMSALILYTDNFAAVDMPLYFYYQNPESILHKTSWDGHAFDIFPALEGLMQRFRDFGADKKYSAELEWFFIWNLLIDSAKDFEKFSEGRAGFSRARKMLRECFPSWRKNRFFRQKPLKFRIRCYLNYLR